SAAPAARLVKTAPAGDFTLSSSLHPRPETADKRNGTLAPGPEVFEPPMELVASLPTLEQLAHYVLETLCAHDHLDPVQTPLAQAVIKRSGRPCGLFFQVQGPRLLKTYAVWAGEEARILFYDASGIRFAEIKLSEAPDPRQLAV